MTMRGNVIVPYTTQYEELVFSPPQDRKNQKMTVDSKVDIWSAACVFWLFAEQVYPWYFSLDKRDIKTALSLIEKYHQIPIPDGFYFTLLLKKMFALDPKERLTPLQILEQLNDLKTKIEKHPEISLKSQLDIYYKKENHSS